MLRRLLDSPWSGAVGALASIVWEAFWLVGGPLGSIGVSDSDRKRFLFWGLIALVICGGQSFVTLIRENKHLKSKLDDKHRIKKAKELIGGVLELLSHCEKDAYDGKNSSDYERLLKEIEEIKRAVSHIATKYLDASFESRFLAVNVLDVHLDEPTRMHFIARTQGNFWTAYQQIKGWRTCVKEILVELNVRQGPTFP